MTALTEFVRMTRIGAILVLLPVYLLLLVLLKMFSAAVRAGEDGGQAPA